MEGFRSRPSGTELRVLPNGLFSKTIIAGHKGGGKLAAEAAWLRDLPPEARRFFPTFHGVLEAAGEEGVSGYLMETVPHPSLAQCLLEDPTHSVPVEALLEEIYGDLMETMYAPARVNASNARTARSSSYYLDRIPKRYRRLSRDDAYADSPFHPVVEEDAVVFNGDTLPGFRRLWGQFLLNEPLRRLAIPPTNGWGHGDMILENILGTPFEESRAKSWRLIDPNPATNSSYYDVSKTLLSLQLAHDLVTGNHFELETERTNGMHGLRMKIKRPELWHAYKEMRERFEGFLDRHSPSLFGADVVWRRRLHLITTLQTLAIAPLHHEAGTDDQGVVFLLLGMRELHRLMEECR